MPKHSSSLTQSNTKSQNTVSNYKKREYQLPRSMRVPILYTNPFSTKGHEKGGLL